MFPKPVTQASASFADVNLVAGVAFDDVDHIFTGACMSTIASQEVSIVDEVLA